MAAPVPTPSDSSAYRLSLFLAFVLIMLSLWTVDMGLIEQQSAPSDGNAVAATSAPHDLQHEARSHRRADSLENLAFGSWGAIPIESENDEVRRKATVALMVYATGNGIRR